MGLFRGGPRPSEGIECRDASVETVDAVSVGEAGVGERVTRVPAEGALELCDRRGRLAAVEVVAPLQVVVVGLDVLRASSGEPRRLGRKEPAMDREISSCTAKTSSISRSYLSDQRW